MRSVEAYVSRTGRLPRINLRKQSGDSEEPLLANWLRYQRRYQSSLTAQQRARLEALPGFEWEPWDSAWDDKYLAYSLFLKCYGRRPRRRSDDPSERSLATWYRNQRARQAHGLLPKHRADELRRLQQWPHCT